MPCHVPKAKMSLAWTRSMGATLLLAGGALPTARILVELLGTDACPFFTSNDQMSPVSMPGLWKPHPPAFRSAGLFPIQGCAPAELASSRLAERVGTGPVGGRTKPSISVSSLRRGQEEWVWPWPSSFCVCCFPFFFSPFSRCCRDCIDAWRAYRPIEPSLLQTNTPLNVSLWIYPPPPETPPRPRRKILPRTGQDHPKPRRSGHSTPAEAFSRNRSTLLTTRTRPSQHRPPPSMSAVGMPPLPSNPAEDASHKILGATLSVTILAFVVWSMRMYVRLVMVRNVGMDVSRPLLRETRGLG